MITIVLTALSVLPAPAVLMTGWVVLSPRFTERARKNAMRVTALLFLVSGLADLCTGATFLGVWLIAVAVLLMAVPLLVQWRVARRDAKQTAQ